MPPAVTLRACDLDKSASVSDAMMVLRHIGHPVATATVVSHEEPEEDDEDSSPMDLSKKHVVPSELPRHLNKPPFLSHARGIQNRTAQDLSSRLCQTLGAASELRWRTGPATRPDEEGSYSSPDSGLHRDSLGEDEDFLQLSRRQSFIPLSRIHARYNQRNSEPCVIETDESSRVSNKSDPSPPDQVQSKRARLDCLIANIKQSKPIGRLSRNSDERSSGEHVTSSDEIPTDLTDSGQSGRRVNMTRMEGFPGRDREDVDEACNLACPKPHSSPETSLFETWKNKLPMKNGPPLSPSEAAKLYGIDPETYQQQMMQLQLTSAAMMGDSGGLLKAMGSYPPWVYLGYYSQLLHSFQAQEILRQYAMQSHNITPTVSQGEKSPSVPRTLGSSGYNCRSPMSPASLSEGPTGLDSDGSMGQTTPGSANGKRAPRAMTGRHVRTGTGASPSTLQTLRLKIEERQRLKAQQQRQGPVSQSHSKGKSSSTKLAKKSKK